MTNRQDSQDGDETPPTLWAKLQRSVVLAFTGYGLGLATFAIHAAAVPPWRAAAFVLLEVVWVFWLVCCLHTWWQFPWLVRLFVSARKRAVILVWSLFLGFVVFLFLAAHFKW